jgi:hypothetical protein
MIWLLDHNIPNKIYGYLKSLGFKSDTTQYKCWDKLSNGQLAKVAFESGYRVLITRDRLLCESAARSLKFYPEMAIVLLNIEQAKGQVYLSMFKEHWEKTPIRPQPGKLIIWSH